MSLSDTLGGRERQVQFGIKTNWLRFVFIGSLGVGGCMAVVLSSLQVLRDEPKAAFDLLKSWGPWGIVLTFALFLAGRFLHELLVLSREGLTAWVGTAEKGADAQTRTADALTRLAEQGGRSAEEVRRLAVYAAQEFPSICERFDRTDEGLKANAGALLKVADSIQALHRRMDEHGFSGKGADR